MTRRDPAAWLLLAALLVLGVGAAVSWNAWTPATWIGLSRISGWLAAALLIASLATRPLAERATRWRRGFGVAAAVAALAHLGLALAGPLRDALDVLTTWPTYRAGLAATVVLTMLLATSFPPVVRALSLRVWKPLHRLSYLAAVLVALHLLGLPMAPVVGALAFTATVALLLVWRLAAWVSGARDRRASR